MNEKSLSVLTRFAIILIGICGLLSCLFCIPISLGNGSFKNILWWSLEFSLQYVFHWIVSLPCFGLLIIAWRITSTMSNGKLFLANNALYINYATTILIIDIIVFLIGNIIFAVVGWNSWLILQVFVAITGLIISIFMYILSKYLMRAAVLQEESDLTV